MNLKPLRFFCEVVETESANLAATRLHVVPAAVSMQIAQLEGLLGGKLFDRSTRPMKLTPLGTFFYPKAKALLSDSQRLLEEAKDLTLGRIGWLSIGFTRSTIFSVLPNAVFSMSVSAPKVRIDLTEILTEHQGEALRSGLIHVGLARAIGPFDAEDDLECTPLFTDPLLVALPSVSPLARRKRLNPGDLAGLPFISYPKDPNSSFSRHTLQALEEAGIKPRVAYEAKEIHTALCLVAAGLGFALVGKSVADNNRSDVRFLPVKGVKTTANVFAIRRKDTQHQLVDAFLDIVLMQSLAR
ncbi:LysR family transcriptional regulator [Variovorax sp. J22G21]|uniref:LysR family transcriptional regulator n=1 Tax=Variovorax fucosicus TaxID=3053517 RepID=UPI0025751165|nr:MULTISPECIES: LysR family transcriptional regulator [unclassified Variovorax]MDM0037736.1 LysR family transcriptional regulator [Variovorax sp. J22R193]MDM0062512.1 LysR family transcriptional regulator [Variovorax sp. J22G21]